MNLLLCLLILLGQGQSQETLPPELSVISATSLPDLRASYEKLLAFEKSEACTSAMMKLVNLNKQNILTKAGVSSYFELAKKTPSVGEHVAGFFTFVNIVQVTAAFILVIAIGWLFGIYFIALIIAVPVEIWEFLMYLLSVFLMISGHYVSDDWQMMLVLPGCLGLFATLMLTLHTHFEKSEYPRHRDYAFGTIGLICFVAWMVVAIYYQSHVIAFLSILALLNAVGFFVAFGSMCIVLGFDKESSVLRGTFAAFVLLATYVGLSLGHVETKGLEIFMPALHFLGAFVYFLGLLIMASKYFWYETSARNSSGKWEMQYNWSAYIGTQVLTIASGVAALFLGSVFGMGSLLGVGGTFFYIYLIEKYTELPWKSIGYAWGLLGLGGILYGIVIFIKSHPQLFIF